MTDILELLEQGEYPDEANIDLMLAATLSLAVSAKRIADLLAAGGPVVTSLAPAPRRIGGGPRPGAAPPPPSTAPAAPQLPADFTPWTGGKIPLDRLAEVTVIYRNNEIHGPNPTGGPHMTAQQFNWTHYGKPHDIIGYRVQPPDQAHRTPTPAGDIPSAVREPASAAVLAAAAAARGEDDDE
jgi:hypothetical protein